MQYIFKNEGRVAVYIQIVAILIFKSGTTNDWGNSRDKF